MSPFTRAFVCILVGLFGLSSAIALLQGEWAAAAGGALIVAFVLLPGAIAGYFKRHPFPKLAPGESSSPSSMLRAYEREHPGWRGRLPRYVAVGSFLLIFGLELARYLGHG